jgi:hypothetical protein
MKLPNDSVGIAFFVCKAAWIVATIVTTVFSYLAAVAAQSPKCAAMARVAGYRSEPSDFIGFPLMLIAAFTLLSWRVNIKYDELRKWITISDVPVFEFASIRITLGWFVLSNVILVSIVWFGAPAAFAIFRFSAIVNYCVPMPAG